MSLFQGIALVGRENAERLSYEKLQEYLGVTYPRRARAAPAAAAPAPAAAADDDDDDIDFFAEEDDAETEAKLAAMEERAQAALAAQAAKGKVKPVAKTSILLDVKPWDDTTDMKELEAGVRAVEMDGLLWGQSKLIAVGYGIKKLQIMCVVEDDKVCVDDLDEKITALEDYVQSIDVAAMNKI